MLEYRSLVIGKKISVKTFLSQQNTVVDDVRMVIAYNFNEILFLCIIKHLTYFSNNNILNTLNIYFMIIKLSSYKYEIIFFFSLPTADAAVVVACVFHLFITLLYTLIIFKQKQIVTVRVEHLTLRISFLNYFLFLF